MNDELLRLHIGMTVPLRIHEIQCDGRGLSEHLARISGYAMDIAAHGDHILFRGTRTVEMVNKLVDALAVMAFVPGGVTLFGHHFEAVLPSVVAAVPGAGEAHQ